MHITGKKLVTIKSIALLAIFSLFMIMIVSFSSCSFAGKASEINQNSSSSTSESAIQDTQEESDATEKNQNGTQQSNQAGSTQEQQNDSSKPSTSSGRVVYLEITSDLSSNHFEHRVANVIAKDIDSGEEELIFCDINERFEIGRVFSVSPDGKKILCDLVEGGRGAYSAICIIDVDDKKMRVLDEFDFTESDEAEMTSGFYGEPIWSSDSKYIAYEVLSNYYSSNIRDRGIYKIDVETGEKKEIELDVGGASLRSTFFLSPVFFFDGNKKIACVLRLYFENSEDADPSILQEKNAELFYVSEENRQPEFQFDLSAFEAQGPEIITSFDNFRYIENTNSFVFQVLGDFEEDGDLWIVNIDDEKISKFTNDEDLREQQPDCYSKEESDAKIAYIGVKRYGTISNQIPSGDIYLTDISGKSIEKLTEYDVGVFKPIFSPDGVNIAYNHAIYDNNFENIIRYDIEIVNTKTKEVTKIAEKGYLMLVGWLY